MIMHVADHPTRARRRMPSRAWKGAGVRVRGVYAPPGVESKQDQCRLGVPRTGGTRALSVRRRGAQESDRVSRGKRVRRAVLLPLSFTGEGTGEGAGWRVDVIAAHLHGEPNTEGTPGFKAVRCPVTELGNERGSFASSSGDFDPTS